VGIESHPPNELARLKRELGKRIRSLREEKGLTRAQLAQACSLRYAYLSNIETGNHDVRLLALISIARSLEVTAELLFNGIL
jgi:transcriptional regulator with XRE-family HTH domain